MTRILAVDDQPANLRLVREVLAPHGLEVLEARSGAEALVVAKESAPDLILLDMHMPDMHGLEVLRRLPESAWGAGLPASHAASEGPGRLLPRGRTRLIDERV